MNFEIVRSSVLNFSTAVRYASAREKYKNEDDFTRQQLTVFYIRYKGLRSIIYAFSFFIRSVMFVERPK